MLCGEVMEIVDRVTGRVSTYPAHGNEFRSMQMQIDWQRRFHPNYRFFYRLRYKIDVYNAIATENAFVIQDIVCHSTFNVII